MKEKGEEKLIIFDRSTNGVIARFDKKKNNSGIYVELAVFKFDRASRNKG